MGDVAGGNAFVKQQLLGRRVTEICGPGAKAAGDRRLVSLSVFYCEVIRNGGGCRPADIRLLGTPAGQRGACEPGFPAGQGAAYRECGVPLRHHGPGLHPDERAAAAPRAPGLVVLGFPSNQFGHQENAKNEEILNSLKYVRSGGGFEPNFMLFEKCEVNGVGSYPLFAFLREALPAPSDDATALMTGPKLITWSPVCRNDVAWNFEKFLVGPDSVPVCRYSRCFQTIDIEPEVEALLSQGPSCA
ncbi:hypothetical protein P7K49_000782 [Saguinus oedipus]|uniref:Glutathione peroxidase n=1 Tax=Saguinus oedipus TaxID=9490 RepID=A0ABQ9WCQ8_SAGOE|nr:hypothetical protein P7K49_000782 [Saguinus oedipus]